MIMVNSANEMPNTVTNAYNDTSKIPFFFLSDSPK